jgi:putative membrane protein
MGGISGIVPGVSEGERVWAPYCGIAPTPAEWLARWNFDPLLLGAFAVVGLIAFGHAPAARRIPLAAAYGLAALLFISPFCALSSALFSARVTHHVLLTAVLAPLLALAWRHVRLAGSLAAWTGGHALLFWIWHAPGLYAAALSSDALYWLMQASLVVSAFGLWATALRAPVPAAVAGLLVTTVQMGLLGALLTFAPAPLYAPHLASTIAWGFTPLEDQQLAGLIMWAPAAGFYLAAALLLLGRWLARQERASAA